MESEINSQHQRPFTMSKKIGFIGTGLMGRGMARNLIRKGHSVRLYNRTRAKAEEVAQAGGEVAGSPAEATAGADVIVTMLSDPEAVCQVMDGSNGVLSTIRPGAVLIDSSTVSRAESLRTLVKIREAGGDMIDAPVFGSKDEAERGGLGFIVGGEPQVLQRVQDVLDCMGRTNYVGGNGMGAQAKLVVNLVIASTLQAFNEGMVLATKAGIAPELMFQIIQSSRARSGIIEMKGPRMLNRDFTPFFPLRLMAKDMRLVQETARSFDLSMPVINALQEVYQASLSNGVADEDFAATIKCLEKQSGVEVRSTANPA
jgi:3-hydroxyisobutyrate dehydrogenase-like beta-hydroxyacid dehydrogenase